MNDTFAQDPPFHQDPRNLLATVRQILDDANKAPDIAVNGENHQKALGALNCLDSILEDAITSHDVHMATQTNMLNDSDAELLRKHHVNMGARVTAIDQELDEINKKLTPLTLVDRTKEFAALDEEERVHERALKEIREKKRVLRELVTSPDPEKAERTVRELSSRKAHLERDRAAYSHIITLQAFQAAPIRRVPIDILTEIFAAAQADEPVMIGTGAGALVAQVCARWRTVAHAHPRLWSSFSFPLFGGHNTVDLLEVTLDRCRATGLTVVVDASAYVPGGLSGHPKMELLAAHAENIVSLRFRGNERSIDVMREVPPLQSFRNRLPRLELLGFSNVWSVMGDAFQVAPRLHTLELGASSDLIDSNSKFPVTQVRTLRFSVSTSGHHLAPFDKLASMVSVQSAQPPPLRIVQHRPTLGSLTTWRVELPLPKKSVANQWDPTPRPSPDTTNNFFARFRTPALQSLHIQHLTSAVGVTMSIDDSRCKLSTLVLEEPSALITADELLHILVFTPSLQTLAIVGGPTALLSDDFFKALTIWHHPLTDILVHLTEFRLKGTYEFTPGLLLDMLHSRTLTGSTVMRLKKIEIGLENQVVPADRARALAEIVDKVAIVDKDGIVVL
ncbi:hypothetical protein B0H16DRAFT_1581501 [Mycena metata]|uniref:F-box domain-containing protein n=1 Tax=Mycena metata TaxID=1033252 RepID=A0AAD7I0I8_9AGAR|nr:hypothetical protein B0H16DRAFT_1581501 [Mycena metata]